MLYRLFKVVQEVHCVGILASTVAISKLNTRIYRSRGRYLFNQVFSIQDLSKVGFGVLVALLGVIESNFFRKTECHC